MAFFKPRKAGNGQSAAPAQPESVDVMRKRARHRLIGATLLVLVGVVGFPLLFDTQPRPVPVNIPIEIPDKNKVKPLQIPPTPVAAKPASNSVAPTSVAPQVASLASVPTSAVPPPMPTASVAQAKPAASSAQSVAPPAAPPVVAPASQAVAKTAAPLESKADAAELKRAQDSARAQALLEGKTVEAAPAASVEGRFVVQVGAFADSAVAHETRLRVERAGLKTYTQIAQTKDGPRTRVRIGPFATRAQADQAAEKLKALELPAQILIL